MEGQHNGTQANPVGGQGDGTLLGTLRKEDGTPYEPADVEYLVSRAARRANERPITYSSIANANPFISDATTARVAQVPAPTDLSQSQSAAAVGNKRAPPPPHLDMSRLNLHQHLPAITSSDDNIAAQEAHAQHLQHVQQVHQPQHMHSVSHTHPAQHVQQFQQVHHAQHIQQLQQTRPSQEVVRQPSNQQYQTSQTQAQGLPRMPMFSITSVADDLASIRSSISPGDPDHLGPLAVSDEGRWMFWQRFPEGQGRGGTWFDTELKVNPHLDPRTFCPHVHAELIKICNEGFDDRLIWSYYELLVSGIDSGRRRAAQMQNNPLFRTQQPHLTDHVSQARGRSQTSNSLRPILKSPDRGRSSQESSRNVMFDLHSTRTDGQQGAPAELLFKPATRPYQRAAGLSVSPEGARAQHNHRQNMSHEEFGRGLGGKRAGAHTQLGTPIHFENAAAHRHFQAPDDTWPKPLNPISPYFLHRSRSAMETVPVPLNIVEHGTTQPYCAPPGSAAFNTDPEKRNTATSTQSSPDKDAASEFSMTDELLKAFPGRLGGEGEDDRRTSKSIESFSVAPSNKLFGSAGVMNRAQQLSSSLSEMKKPSPMRRFAGLANKLIPRKTRDQAGEVMRMFGDAMGKNTSSTPLDPSARESVSATSSDPSSTDFHEQRLPNISILPGRQMWIMGRVEFILNLTANQFLMTQKEADRMKLETVAKLTKKWFQKNRPLPTEFMFDLKTQMELVHANLDTFFFYGSTGLDTIGKAAMMHSWRNVVRELYNRTFCLPDHALKKLMVDATCVLEMLGGVPESFVEIKEIKEEIAKGAAETALYTGEFDAEQAKQASGQTRELVLPPAVSNRGVIDDEDEYYDDGIYKG